MNNQNSTKDPSIMTEKLIDIASSDCDTSGDESSSERFETKHKLIMNKSENCPKISEHSTNKQTINNCQKVVPREQKIVEIESENCQIYPESKWSFSGGSVLGLLSTNTDNDYSLWLRIKEKQKIKESNSSFFGSTILSLLSGQPKEKYSFDNILIADDITSASYQPLSTSSSQDKDKLLINNNNNKNNNKNNNNKNNNNNNNITKNTKHKRNKKHNNSLTKNEKMGKNKMKDFQYTTNKCETENLMLCNNQLYETTNINLNDDDDDDDFLPKKDHNNFCDFGLYKGIVYALLSSLFFSLSCVIVKYLKNIHPGQLAVVRYVGVLLLSIPLLVYHKQSPLGPPEMQHLLILRGLCGATSLFLRFYAFRYLPIADASVIVFAIPIFVSIFGYYFLNEPCGFFQTFIVLLAMFGLALSTKLPFLFGDTSKAFLSTKNGTLYEMEEILENVNVLSADKSSHILGVSAGLLSLLFSSLVFVFIRKAKGVHYSVIMVWFGAVAIIETTILTLLLHGFTMPETTFEWRLMIFLAVFAFCGQILLTRALQLEYAGSISVARSTSDIAFGFVWQITIFNELPDGYSIAGALLVSSCIFFITIKNWVNSLPEHSRMRSRLRFVTL